MSDECERIKKRNIEKRHFSEGREPMISSAIGGGPTGNKRLYRKKQEDQDGCKRQTTRIVRMAVRTTRENPNDISLFTRRHFLCMSVTGLLGNTLPNHQAGGKTNPKINKASPYVHMSSLIRSSW
jgi:hypothetical protein